MSRPHTIVVGAGIVGASIAYHLAKSGARVIVVEGGEPGGIATRASWAWINASWGNPEPYFRLRQRAMAEWRRLGAELPAVQPQWGGGLLWDLPPEGLAAYAAEHGRWGYGIRKVDAAEIARLEPALREPPALALHVAAEGAVDPVAAALAMLAAAQSHGAELQRTRVLSLETHAGRVSGIITADGVFRADAVVLAAGAATAELAASAGVKVPMSTPPGLLVQTQPAPKILNGLVMAPAMHVRQLADGSLLAGADFGGSNPGTDAEATAREVLVGLQRLLKSSAPLAFARYQIGYRPLPADGFPIFGPALTAPGLYLAITHSGVTLAPALGLFAADELLTGRRDALLAPYAPARFS